MENNNQKIAELVAKLDRLSKRHAYFSNEIDELRDEIYSLRSKKSSLEIIDQPSTISESELSEFVPEQPKRAATPPLQKPEPQPTTTSKLPKIPKISLDLEKFIGENLISKIGILFTIIGVAIGAKYSIENNLINPQTRIILGYLSGIILLGFGIKLKEKYEAYSAVLVSGAMAIMYFITFAGYSFYNLFPQLFAFGLMVVFTAFTVFAAIKYNRQVIALIGLVGAYAVPFLLSNGSGDMMALFSYMAIINVGILFIAFKKYWKPVYYAAFILTWMIYLGWFTFSQNNENFSVAMLFATLFFGIFYLTFLGYKLIQKEELNKSDVFLLLGNSFIYFGVGYFALENHPTGQHLLGLFALGNALIHFIVSAVLYKRNLGNKNLFYLVAILVLTFITIAIPIELDGNWVTLLWMAEACLLFWLGRTKTIPAYEYVSYAMMLLAIGSLYQDWDIVYNYPLFGNSIERIPPLFNIHFLTSVLSIGAFAFINYLFFNKNYPHPFEKKWESYKLTSYVLPTTLVVLGYLALKGELTFYWDQLFFESKSMSGENNRRGNYDLIRFKNVWLINYTLFFLAGLSFFNLKKLKNKELGMTNLVLNIIGIAAFLGLGLVEFDSLRRSYLNQDTSVFSPSRFNLGIRYISYGFVGLLLWASYLLTKQSFINKKFTVPFDLILHFTILVVAGNELVNLMQVFNSDQSYKLGLSILMGAYALVMVGLGIWKRKKHLRMAAFALFGITLLKVITFDLAHLDTISKTVVFMSLGVLLLIISFLYNKYKNLIGDEEEF